MASQRDYQPPELLSMEASRVVQLKLGDTHTEPPILAYGLPATWQHNACTTILAYGMPPTWKHIPYHPYWHMACQQLGSTRPEPPVLAYGLPPTWQHTSQTAHIGIWLANNLAAQGLNHPCWHMACQQLGSTKPLGPTELSQLLWTPRPPTPSMQRAT